MIVANGPPKSGTHALMRLLQASGGDRLPGLLDGMRDGLRLRGTAAYPNVPALDMALAQSHSRFIHGHVPTAHHGRLRGALIVTVRRHPREIAVSYARWKTDGDVAAAIRTYCGRSLPTVVGAFLGSEITVQYEDIAAAASLAPGGLYRGATEDHDTWTGAPSNWRDWWTDEAEVAWIAARGPELEEAGGW